MSRTKLVLIGVALGIVLAALLAFLFAGRIASAPALHGSYINPPLPVSDFTLVSAEGPVSLDDFEGKLVVLFFGYTFCPDVCPTTMANLKNAFSVLGDETEDVQVLFVSVDPERDSPERMKQFASGFQKDFVGLTGPPDSINAIASRMGIFHARQEGSDATGYLVDHTATTMVLDRNGDIVLMWPFGITGDEMAADLKALLK